MKPRTRLAWDTGCHSRRKKERKRNEKFKRLNLRAKADTVMGFLLPTQHPLGGLDSDTVWLMWNHLSLQIRAKSPVWWKALEEGDYGRERWSPKRRSPRLKSKQSNVSLLHNLKHYMFGYTNAAFCFDTQVQSRMIMTFNQFCIPEVITWVLYPSCFPSTPLVSIGYICFW